jgi:hypothetical protein
VGGGFFVQAFIEQREGERERELRVGARHLGGKGVEQRADRGHGAAEDELELVVGEQSGGVEPVAAGLGVADRLHDVPVLLVPACRGHVEAADERRVEAPQLQAQKIAEQRVVAEPRAPDVERGHEHVGALELVQDALGARTARQRVGQWAADALEYRRAQQQVAHLGRLPLEHLGQQIARDRALGTAELADEGLRVGMTGQRARREPQPCRPALGSLVQ